MATATKTKKKTKKAAAKPAKKRTAQKAATKKAAPKKAVGKKATKKVSVASKAATKTKAKGKEPERSTPTLAEVDADVLEFIAAIDDFKQKHARPFPSWSEVLLIVRELGYQRVK